MENWAKVARNSPDSALIQLLQSRDFNLEAIAAAHTELTRRAEIASVPHTALYEWRREMAAGKRDAYKFDDLWRKACDEASRAEWQTIMLRRPPHQSHQGRSSLDDDLPF